MQPLILYAYMFSFKLVSIDELRVFLEEHKGCLCVKGWLMELKTPSSHLAPELLYI